MRYKNNDPEITIMVAENEITGGMLHEIEKSTEDSTKDSPKDSTKAQKKVLAKDEMKLLDFHLNRIEESCCAIRKSLRSITDLMDENDD